MRGHGPFVNTQLNSFTACLFVISSLAKNFSAYSSIKLVRVENNLNFFILRIGNLNVNRIRFHVIWFFILQKAILNELNCEFN